MKRRRLYCVGINRPATSLLLAMVALLSGCNRTSTSVRGRRGLGERKVFALREITPDQALAFLSELGLGKASVVPDRNAVVVTGSYSDLHRAGVVLDLVDTLEEFVIETLASVSAARTVPANDQIAEMLGNMAVGTFAEPPDKSERLRAVIDIHGESVVAIIPARVHRELLLLALLGWKRVPVRIRPM